MKKHTIYEWTRMNDSTVVGTAANSVANALLAGASAPRDIHVYINIKNIHGKYTLAGFEGGKSLGRTDIHAFGKDWPRLCQQKRFEGANV